VSDTDPRLYRCCDHCQPGPTPDLCGDHIPPAPRDTHDTSCPSGCNDSLPAGVVRVDTRDEALAKWLGHRRFPAPAGLPGYMTIGTETARAVLAALREQAR
jgi:hypothetical protein